ncbi:MAG: hypothetical protein Q8Q18_01020 [bacterium]|nr:hypothetical protein [bacterium]
MKKAAEGKMSLSEAAHSIDETHYKLSAGEKIFLQNFRHALLEQ